MDPKSTTPLRSKIADALGLLNSGARLRTPISILTCAWGSTCAHAQVQNISAWTLDVEDRANQTVNGITYEGYHASPETITTAVGVYDAGTAAAGADSVFVRRNTATPTSTTNVAGQAIGFFSGTGGSTTVRGTYNATMEDLFQDGNILNSTMDTFANTTSGVGNTGHNIERIDFVWSGGYTVIGDEVIIVFNLDRVGGQDDFRVAAFTAVDNSADKVPTAYANTGVLVTGTNYPDKLPLNTAIPGTQNGGITSPTSAFRTTGVDDFSGTPLNTGTDPSVQGIGGVAISLASLGLSPGQVIYGYSLIAGDTTANTAADLLDFTDNSIYPTSTPDADQSGTADFSTFGGKIATLQVTLALGAFEWDNGQGTSTWGTVPGGANNNWDSPLPAEDNRTPLRDSDVIFGAIPTTAQTVDLGDNVEVRKMTFDSTVNYTIGTSGDTPAITFGDPNLAGAPSIEIGSSTGRSAQHKINADINLVENIAINNNSFSVLCINGTVETRSSAYPGGNTITVNGIGAVNFNDDISGAGNLIKNGTGIATINNDNSTDPDGGGSLTQWTGNVTVNEGQLVITADGALGGSVTRATNANRTTGATTLQVSNANGADLKIGQLVTGTNIPEGTFITGYVAGLTDTTVTLSNAITGNINSGANITFAGATTVTGPGTLTLRSTQTGTAGNYTNTALNYTVAEGDGLGGTGSTRLPADNTGAIYNDGGDNTLGANVTLRLTGGGAAINSRDDNLTINGVIRETSAGQALGKIGEGVVTLTNAANSYTGATIIANGALRIATNETALPGGFATGGPSGGNLVLDGGVLEIGLATAFTRALGTGADQVQFTGDGGFSAFDTTAGLTRTVTLGGSVAWGSGSFVPTGNALLLSSNYSNGLVDFTNAINLGDAVREVRVANGSNAVDARLSGVLGGNAGGGLNKTGAGTLELTADNTYTGETRISGGALRIDNANRINGSDLVLGGGVLEINGDLDTGNTGEFTRSVGTTGADDVRWTGDGGFSAAGANREVRLNNGTASVTWGGATPTSGFVGADNALILGSVSSDNTVTLANGLFLDGTGTRTIRTVAGTAAGIANGTLSGVVSGAATLAVTGNGRLDLTAVNTNSGPVSITGAEVRLTGAATMASAVNDGGTSGITLRQGGRLVLDYSASGDIDRIGNSTDIAMSGGRLDMFGRNGTNGNALITETVGVLRSIAGENQINVQRTTTNATVLAFDSLDRIAGSTLNFTNDTSGGTLGNTGNHPRVTFASSPTLEQAILPYAVYGDGATPTRFATITSGRVTGNNGSNVTEGSWSASTIQNSGTNDIAITGNRTVGAIILGNGADITQTGSRTLTVDTGGILSTGGTVSNISVSNLQVGGGGNRELITHVYGTGGLNISSAIQDNGNTTGLTKSGDGTLTLSGSTANTYTGVTTVNAGTLVLNKTGTGANSIAVAGDGTTATRDIIVGDGRGIDILRLGANEQIADGASVKLVGGEVGNSLNVARLELNGSTDINTASRIETFHTLEVTGNSVLDFGGGSVCSPTFLFLDVLTVASDAVLTVTNWIEFTDFLLVAKAAFDETQLPRIVFDGYSGTAQWQDYNSGYYQITPVPEPAAFGLLACGGLTAFAALRRRRRAEDGHSCPSVRAG